MTSTPSLDRLSDQALLCEFGDLVQQGHRHTASLLRHIDAIDQRKLWAKQGHPSMFEFCVAGYHMSESTAGKRIGAARTARRFPVLFAMVARGEIHLSGIHRLNAHLTPENYERVLAEAKHKTVRQIEQIVARLAPQPDVPSTLRALPRRPATVPPTSALAPIVPAAPVATEPVATAPGPRTPPSPRRSPDPVPLAPGRYKLQVTLDENTRDKLKQLQDLLAHQIPSGDPAAIIARALDALLTQVQKRKAALTGRPRASRPAAGRRTREVPAALRRGVWKRDQGRCAFVSEDGHRCNETRCLEFAHLHPWGKRGGHSASNVALRCRAHNAFEAECDFGASFMASKRKRKPLSKLLKVREPVVRYVARIMSPGKDRSTNTRGTPTAIVGDPVLPARDRVDGSNPARSHCDDRFDRGPIHVGYGRCYFSGAQPRTVTHPWTNSPFDVPRTSD